LAFGETPQLAACRAKESILQPGMTNSRIEFFNAKADYRASTLFVSAVNDDPFLLLPPLSHPIERISIRISTPAAVTFETYAISDDRPDWPSRPIRVHLHSGDNQISVPVPPGTTRLRIDPGDLKLTYSIQEISYLSECR
jgi:hypothetical protein